MPHKRPRTTPMVVALAISSAQLLTTGGLGQTSTKRKSGRTVAIIWCHRGLPCTELGGEVITLRRSLSVTTRQGTEQLGLFLFFHKGINYHDSTPAFESPRIVTGRTRIAHISFYLVFPIPAPKPPQYSSSSSKEQNVIKPRSRDGRGLRAVFRRRNVP